MARDENRVTAACQALLQLAGAFVWRQNTGGTRVHRRGREKVIRYGVKGGSDLMAVMPGTGRFLGCECKRPEDKLLGKAAGEQSEDQGWFQREVEHRGGLYVLAWSSEDLEAVLRREGYFRGSSSLLQPAEPPRPDRARFLTADQLGQVMAAPPGAPLPGPSAPPSSRTPTPSRSRRRRGSSS